MTHLSMVPNIHLGSLLKGITMPWKRAIFTAISPEMLASGRSSVTRRRLCGWRQRAALRPWGGWRERGAQNHGEADGEERLPGVRKASGRPRGHVDL